VQKLDLFEITCELLVAVKKPGNGKEIFADWRHMVEILSLAYEYIVCVDN
jgi:hypothetical protein